MTNLKRPKLAAMLFAAVLCSMPANGETITYYNNENPDDILNESQFEIDSYLETATLTKFQHWYYDENVVIPETFEYGGTTYTITAIGEEAFYSEYDDYDDILTLTIPETVTTIGVKFEVIGSHSIAARFERNRFRYFHQLHIIGRNKLSGRIGNAE